MLADIGTLFVLTVLEIILSIDNLIFISLSIDKTQKWVREKVRFIGLGLALLMRLVVLFFTSLVLFLQKPMFYVLSLDISIKDLLMLAGGLFLVIKSATELSHDIRQHQKEKKKYDAKPHFFLVIAQIILIDLVFSIDSILIAIALTHNMIIIVIAFTFSILAMIFLSNYAAKLIKSHPRLKLIAILFVLFVGIYLILEGVHVELSKGYLYCSFIFALLVDIMEIAKKGACLAIDFKYLKKRSKD